MLRIPFTSNSKCKEEGIDSEVKIIQEWDGKRPDFRLLVGAFHANLVGKSRRLLQRGIPPSMLSSVKWIEKLLQTPIDDYRKHVRDLILVPYLVLNEGLTDEYQISDIVMEWADKCAAFRRLDPSRREFECGVRYRVRQIIRSDKKVPHMGLDTLKEEYPELWEKLKGGGEGGAAN